MDLSIYANIIRDWTPQRPHLGCQSKFSASTNLVEENKYTQTELVILFYIFVYIKAAEKALVAWQYMDDARRVRRSENLANLPQSLPRELRRLATDLEILTQGVMKMKYPDGTYIPSRAYTRDQANQAMELANEIIEKVDEYLR